MLCRKANEHNRMILQNNVSLSEKGVLMDENSLHSWNHYVLNRLYFVSKKPCSSSTLFFSHSYNIIPAY